MNTNITGGSGGPYAIEKVPGYLVRANYTAAIVDLSQDGYQKMLETLRGSIEAIDILPDLTMWVNSEFSYAENDVNVVATILCQPTRIGFSVKGDVIFTGGEDSEGEPLPLSKERLADLDKTVMLTHGSRDNEFVALATPETNSPEQGRFR
jgi:hypothetical protein